MKIILTAAVSKLGKIGDIVEVANGFAKNFLIPNKKAICHTPNNIKIFEANKHEFEKANQDNLSAANSLKEKISGKNVIIIQNASDDGRLYGSVNSSIIALEINKLSNSTDVATRDVFLQKPIKEVGLYSVTLDLHSEVSFDVKVVVARSDSEAEALLSEKKESAKEESEAKPTRKAPRKNKEEATEEVVEAETA